MFRTSNTSGTYQPYKRSVPATYRRAVPAIQKITTSHKTVHTIHINGPFQPSTDGLYQLNKRSVPAKQTVRTYSMTNIQVVQHSADRALSFLFRLSRATQLMKTKGYLSFFELNPLNSGYAGHTVEQECVTNVLIDSLSYRYRVHEIFSR